MRLGFKVTKFGDVGFVGVLSEALERGFSGDIAREDVAGCADFVALPSNTKSGHRDCNPAVFVEHRGFEKLPIKGYIFFGGCGLGDESFFGRPLDDLGAEASF